MKITYTPEDGERQEFVFRPGELFSFEAELLEECGGQAWNTFEEYGERFMAGHFKARRAALWVCLRRQNPKLRLSDLVVRVAELTVTYDDDELARMLTGIENDPDLTDEERAEQIEAIKEARTPSSSGPVGKDEPGATGTGSPSPELDSEPSLSS